MNDIKNLFLKFKYLKSELERSEHVVDISKKEFYDRVLNLQKDLNVYDKSFDSQFSSREDKTVDSNFQNSEFSEQIDPPETNKKTSQPPWAKKLFRKIATITHPDKVPESLDSTVKDQFLNFYKSAAKSYNEESFLDLIDIADRLGIEVTGVSPSDIDNLNLEINDIEVKINKLRSTIFWDWWHMDELQKNEAIKEFVRHRGWENNRSQAKKSREGHPGKSISWYRKKIKKNDL
jgi:hypothetical protein